LPIQLMIPPQIPPSTMEMKIFVLRFIGFFADMGFPLFL
jgi:hypothetical protein